MSEVVAQGTPTPILGLTMPTVGDDIDIWGDLTNANWEILDKALLTTGGAMTGPFSLAADPTTALQAATKGYVDGVASAYLPLTGGSLSGVLGVTDSLTIQATGGNWPTLAMYQNAAPADQQYINIFERPSGDFGIQFVNNAGSAGSEFLGATRSGYQTVTLSLTAPSINLTGAVACSGGVNAVDFSASGAIYPATGFNDFYLSRSAGSRYLSWATGYYMSWAESGGTLSWFGNGAGIMSLGPTGNLWTAGGANFGAGLASPSVTASVGLYPYSADTTFAIYRNASGIRLLQFQSGYYLAWNEVGGTWSWEGGGAGLMSLDGGGNLWCASNGNFGNELTCNGTGVTYANVGVHGFNFRWDGVNYFARVDNTFEVQLTSLSDERVKADIAPSTFDCLAAVLATPLFQFRRKILDAARPLETAEAAADAPLVQVGFVAQRNHAGFPDAVIPGSDEGKSDGATTFWQMNHNTLAAALCGAVQQLAARVVALEGAGTA